MLLPPPRILQKCLYSSLFLFLLTISNKAVKTLTAADLLSLPEKRTLEVQKGLLSKMPT